jgi:hypothetical protein
LITKQVRVHMKYSVPIQIEVTVLILIESAIPLMCRGNI